MTSRNQILFELSQEVIPAGVNSPVRAFKSVGGTPVFFQRAQGARAWDVDGREYIDYVGSWGPLVVGHAHPEVVAAVQAAAANGLSFGAPTEAEYELAAALCRTLPSLELVRLVSSGTEATMSAIRLARGFTGRDRIVKFEGCYHGGNETLLVSVKPSKAKEGDPRFPNAVPSTLGIPESSYRNTLVAPFNDLEAVEEIVRKNADDVAGMILEPIPMNMGFVLPKPGFLEGLRSLADQYGFVLIFDEIKTCGKFYGGIRDYVNVQPDLITLGKAIGGGVPISAVAGKRKIMETIVPGVVSHAGTFNSNPLCVAAGIATLSKVLTKPAMNRAARFSRTLAKGYQDVIDDEGLRAHMSQAGLSGAIAFSSKPVTDWRSFQACDTGKWFAYCFAMMNRGIIPAGPSPDEQWTVSVVHTKDDIEEHLEAFKEVVGYVKKYDKTAEIVEAI